MLKSHAVNKPLHCPLFSRASAVL